MEQFKQGFFYGCIGGIILYIVEVICSTLPYINVSNLLFEFLVITCITLGCVISIFVLLYKRSMLIEMIFRFVAMIVSYVCVLMINGYIGTIRFMYKLININFNSASDNVSGMLTITFSAIVISICIIMIVVVAIKRIFIKRQNW